MRRIEYTSAFKKDYKRELKGKYQSVLNNEFQAIISAIAQNQPLDARHRDHALIGEWKDHRDCHIKPDLVLIYRLPTYDILQLVRLGTHSELGF